MNKAQKQVTQAQLNREKQTIKELKQVYQQALKDCEKKISELSARTDMENLQSIIYQKQYQEALKAQLEGVLSNLQSNSYATVSDYLTKCYRDGYTGVMYDLQKTGIPIIMPIDQAAVVRAIQTDSKLSKSLYDKMGEDVTYLKKAVRAEVSRGIANGSTWNEVAGKLSRHMANTPFQKAYNNSIRIARTEGHRIQVQSALDAQHVAKSKGADIVKQWDATLDGATREHHQMLDGQIREVDEPFEVANLKVEAPGMFGLASEDCNCRCCLLQRARWALDDEELQTLRKRAEYFDLDKTDEFGEYQRKYLGISQYDIRKYDNALEDGALYRKKSISDDIFETLNVTKADSIRPKTIRKKLNKSEVGKETLTYLQDNKLTVNMCYGIDNPHNLYGYYDSYDDEITIFCDQTITADKTTEIIVHEVTHRKLGSKGTFEEEVKCFEAEVLHRKGKLTAQDKEDIIKKVRERYPELS